MFLMTDGTPSDARAYGEAVKEVQRRSFGSIIACAVGPKAGHEHLKLLTDKVVALETLDSTAFSGFFQMGQCQRGFRKLQCRSHY